jgi:hypothetical protein
LYSVPRRASGNAKLTLLPVHACDASEGDTRLEFPALYDDLVDE